MMLLLLIGLYPLVSLWLVVQTKHAKRPYSHAKSPFKHTVSMVDNSFVAGVGGVRREPHGVMSVQCVRLSPR